MNTYEITLRFSFSGSHAEAIRLEKLLADQIQFVAEEAFQNVTNAEVKWEVQGTSAQNRPVRFQTGRVHCDED